MTMMFYLGKEFHTYDKKFQVIKEYIRKLSYLKTGSKSEVFRWMLDRMYVYVMEKLGKEGQKERDLEFIREGIGELEKEVDKKNE